MLVSIFLFFFVLFFSIHLFFGLLFFPFGSGHIVAICRQDGEFHSDLGRGLVQSFGERELPRCTHIGAMETKLLEFENGSFL